MADTSKKVSELETASQVNNDDLVMLSQGSSQSGFASVKATILAIAQKIITGINFTSALETESKTIAGAINEVAQGGGGGGSGHTILDDSGTSLAQEDDLQFKGTYSHDDSTNGKTVVEITREMTQAQYDLLSADEKKGIIRITDDNYVCDGTEVKYSTGVSVKDKIDNVDGKTIKVFSLVLRQIISSSGAINTYGGRKFSDYDLLTVNIGTIDSNNIFAVRSSVTIPSSVFANNTKLTMNTLHGSLTSSASNYSVGGMGVTHIDDTSVLLELTGSQIINAIEILGYKLG